MCWCAFPTKRIHHWPRSATCSAPWSLAAVVFVSAGAGGRLVMFLFARRRQRELSRLREEGGRPTSIWPRWGRLAGSVAHEVRNPLSALRGLVQFLAKGSAARTPARPSAPHTAVSEVDRLERVVSGLLDYTRPRPPRLIPLDLGQESVEGTIRLLADEPPAPGGCAHKLSQARPRTCPRWRPTRTRCARF